MTILIILLVYLLGALLAYGSTFAYFQKNRPRNSDIEYRRDRELAVQVGLGSWIGFLVAISQGWKPFRHGFKFK